MDAQRFDDLTRALATTTSRRTVLKTLAGSAAGGLLALLGVREAAADDTCKPTGKKCRKAAQCCASTVAHATATCTNRTCGFACDATYRLCNGTCIPEAHCCTAADCTTGYVCENGACFKSCDPNASVSCTGPCSTSCFCNPSGICVDESTFAGGACASTADCPSGTICSPGIFSGNPTKPKLCTRPCPCPA